ncbi:metallophosphoesterase [Microlunatus ginsengisoli]|uniref:Calcineurin-like phosphoesterase domain-containing protein n=1 Tax=Microlunatus ginsengisoli TaxID=363863 RepID=A0ABP7A4Q4_9ACTN
MDGAVWRDEWGHRFAVIGDVGGQRDALRGELARLGADPETGDLPHDLVVIQVGDLVHRGPDSAGVIALVDRYLHTQPGQWIQLVGNHEARYLAAPSFDWPERLDDESVATLRGWWADGLLLVAADLHDIGGEDILITHAGLTEGYWRRVLGAPADVGRVAQLLNAMIGSRDELLFRPGQMLGGGRPNLAAGPLWASATTELMPGWLEAWLPFSQVHGHSSLYDWAQDRFLVDRAIAGRTRLDLAARHAVTTLDRGRIVGIDPGHGATAVASWRSWEPGLG